MHVRLLAFGFAESRAGFREIVAEYSAGETPRQIVARTAPALDLSSIRVAVDCEYAEWDAPLHEQALEIALIPPVSGG